MKARNLLTTLLVFATFLLFNTAIQAKPSWPEFIKNVKQEALNQGIRPKIIKEAFQGIRAPSRKVLSLDRSQPEKRLTFLKYRNTRGSKYRILIGRRKLKKYHVLLNKVGNEYGVSPCFITSLWGLETSYGSFMGSFPVIHSLATLAYDNRRAAFFKKQLFLALHILNGDHVSVKDFKGEWAGATGQPQFLPSSWHDYAVDYSGDGKKDIWKNHGDIFASIANYLKQHGWRRGEPWAIPVRLPAHFDESLMTLKVNDPISKSVDAWREMGVRPIEGRFPNNSYLNASIVHPYGGPTLMIFNNFKVIMKWNRSIYYAGTVGYVAEQICRKKL
ncbi:MAG: lytic murein transglycosylase [Gammaproteobacteria bacterium]|nr:lytic murein transglycosylase [Gammaproteobacteria bacterium]MCH9743303.1 lytic murein transglycosylase [Gammaproteobacteria bacterium]